MPVGAIPGLHHITSICGAPQENLDFYAGLLGQRLVKKTVNFDAPETYHLYYGDDAGSPGTIMTFFPFVGAAPGRAGPGMASAVAYRVSAEALNGWVDRRRLDADSVDKAEVRFGARVVVLHDPDGAPVELIETDSVNGEALAGFHSVTLWERNPEPTARLLTEHLGYDAAGSETGRTERLRFVAKGKGPASIIDIVSSDAPGPPRSGVGTIHHIAFRAESDDIQLEWRERLLAAGCDVTPVIDRQYFNAIYFREPGGVLFEIATDPPGFAVDEAPGSLGTALKLPPKYEHLRARIERVLPPLELAS